MNAKSRKGIALIETIVGMTLLLILLFFTAPFMMVTLKHSSSTKKVGVSSSVESIVESKLRNLDYYDVTSALNKGNTSCEDSLNKGINTVTIQENGKTVTYGTYYSIVELEPGVRKRVTVTICWKDRGKIRKREVIFEKTKW